mgnify:CR=1 FL=1
MTRVSVIVVSRGRPGSLMLCLTGIGQLCHRSFEVIVVADPAGCAAVSQMGWGARVKLVAFDAPNISAARNAGLAQAAGEIVAFIDDDAVPEPTWLDQLAAPFGDAGVAATGGYVIGRNGISYQWTARAANRFGESITLDAPGDDPFEPVPPDGFVPRTEGTNCAFRRNLLAGIGGFDRAFRYYLDETDVNLRLADIGARTVIVPRALVHHGYAGSDRRATDRTPRDLTEIGASVAVFLRKHAAEEDPAAVLARLKAAQRRALLRHMVAGGLEPRDVGRRLEGLEAGFEDGLRREIAPLLALPEATNPFRSFEVKRNGQATHYAGRSWQRARLRRKAADALVHGETVTLFCFSPTALPHRMRFHPGGWWEQTGGLFGRSVRNHPPIRLASFRARVAEEWARVAPMRQCR